MGTLASGFTRASDGRGFRGRRIAGAVPAVPIRREGRGRG